MSIRPPGMAAIIGTALIALAPIHAGASNWAVTSSAPLAGSFSLEVQYDNTTGAFLQQSLDQTGIRIQFLADFDNLQAIADPGTRIIAAVSEDGTVYVLTVHSPASIFGDGLDNDRMRIYPSLIGPGTHPFDWRIDPASGMTSLMIDNMPYRSDSNSVPAGARFTRVRFGYPLRSNTNGSALFDNVIISEPGTANVAIDDDFESGNSALWDLAVP